MWTINLGSGEELINNVACTMIGVPVAAVLLYMLWNFGWTLFTNIKQTVKFGAVATLLLSFIGGGAILYYKDSVKQAQELLEIKNIFHKMKEKIETSVHKNKN